MTETKTVKVPPPDGGYGWIVVMAAFCNFTVRGTHFTAFSLLYHTIVEHFEISYAVAGFVGSISVSFSQLPAFLYATLVERKGARFACMAGSAIAGAGFVLSAFATNIFVLYVTYGVFTGCGMGIMFNANVVIVQQYFDKKRGKASALSMAGISFGAIFGAWLVYFALNKYGLSGAMLLLAGYDLHGLVFGALLRPVQASRRARSKTVQFKYDDSLQVDFTHSETKGSHLKLKTLSYADSLQKDAAQNNGIASNLEVQSLGDNSNERNEYPRNGGDNNMKRTYDAHNCNFAALPIQDEAERLARSDDHQTGVITPNSSNSLSKENEAMLDKPKSPASENKNNKSLSSTFDFSLLRDPVFFIYGFSTLLMNFGMVAYRMHNPSRAVHYGVSPQQAALIPQVTGAANFFSQIFFGMIADCACTDRKLLYAFGILVGGIVEVTMVFCMSFIPIMLHSILFGICNGSFLSVQSTVLVDLLSVEKIARSQALLGMFIGVAGLIVTPFAGFLYDVTHNYNIPYAVTGCIQIAGGLLLTFMFVTLKCRRTNQDIKKSEIDFEKKPVA